MLQFHSNTQDFYTEYTQKNGAVSKVNKKFISHLTRAQRIPSTAATVQVSHALPAFASHDTWCVFSKPCTKLTLHCNHRSGHLKTEHTQSVFLLRRHLGNWPRRKHEKRTAGSAWETRIVAAVDGVRCACVSLEINFLLTFEIAPFFCVYPVFLTAVYGSTIRRERIVSFWWQ